jgi:arginine:pyruvate transaminase
MRYASITRRLEGLGADKWALHFAALAKIEAGEKVVMLSIGEPDFAAPRAVAAAAIRGIEAGRTNIPPGAARPTCSPPSPPAIPEAPAGPSRPTR